jgi:lipopolysaccharide transport system ATP-binding protein
MPTNLLTIANPFPTPAAKPVIRLEGVSVRYRVPQERIPSLKEYAIRRLKRTLSFRDFWALDGINLEIRSGEVVGIIGPNGAGKSTLLKVISRVLPPTRGRVRVHGWVSPLLELGAGFDHELTGRENIFLNGLILGYSKKEIADHLDRIVEFSGISDFIDSPLRTYSSGMLARLGFAIATDKQPSILLVDEVLSVGDVDFQRRSADRISSFHASGTTILLVSHSLEAVINLCTRTLWIDRGRILMDGHTDSVVKSYQNLDRQKEADLLAASPATPPPSRLGSRQIEIVRVWFTDRMGEEATIFETGDSWNLHMQYRAHRQTVSPIFGLAIHRQDGVHICGPNTTFSGLTLPTLQGMGTVVYRLPRLPLLEGLYQVTAAVVNRDDTEIFDLHDRLYPFRVVNHSGRIKERYGLIALEGSWKCN